MGGCEPGHFKHAGDRQGMREFGVCLLLATTAPSTISSALPPTLNVKAATPHGRQGRRCAQAEECVGLEERSRLGAELGDRGGVAPQSPETDARKAPVQRLAKSVSRKSSSLTLTRCGISPG